MSKLVSLRDAVAGVADGTHVALGGFAITRGVVAVAHELIRAGVRDLELSQVIGGFDTDLLVGGGCVRRIVCSGGSLDRFGPLHAVNRAILSGEIEAEEYSSLAVTLRFQAGALGIPFLPTKSMLGSTLLADIIARGEGAVQIEDPFTRDPLVALAPLHPDVAFVHVDVADHAGNAVISGPLWGMRETALAAERTILLAEEVVPTGSLDPDRVTIPAPFVTAVAEVPRGAHPTAVCGRYDFDRGHLEQYVAAAATGGADYQQYLDEFVRGPASHEQYLERAGVLV